MESLGTVVSPKAPCSYPWLNTPDTAFNQNHFKVNIILDPDNNEAHAAFVADLEEKMEASRKDAVKTLEAQGGKGKAKLKKLAAAPVLTPEYDDEGDETGRLIVRFKQAKLVQYKDNKTGEKKTFDATPVFLDVSGKKLKEVPSIFGGSVLQINSPAYTYYAESSVTYGITLKINAVRIVELSDGSSNKDYGFGDDDYSADEAPTGNGGDF